MQVPVTVDRSLSAESLYKALSQSQCMSKRGYAILYSNDYGHGNYGLCYSHNNDSIYIHVRVLCTDPPSTFRYFIALGERKHKNQIDIDLQNLTSEIEATP